MNMTIYMRNLTNDKDFSITLPMQPEELTSRFNSNCEYIVIDYDGEIEINISEYTSLDSIRTLNILAKLIDDDTTDKTAVNYFIKATNFDLQCDYLSICNYIHADEIGFYVYDFQGVEYCDMCSNMELYGRTIAEQNGMMDKLEEIGAVDYFDFENYGNSEAINDNATLFEEGYIICDKSENHNLSIEDFEMELF